jgi:hypothetical protein
MIEDRGMQHRVSMNQHVEIGGRVHYHGLVRMSQFIAHYTVQYSTLLNYISIPTPTPIQFYE